MPRFTLHQPASASQEATSAPGAAHRHAQQDENAPAPRLPDELKSDARLHILGVLPRMILIECAQNVADEWQERLSGWVLKPEHKASIPDPRPRLRK